MTLLRENIDALTGLRFLAALTIVLGHTVPGWLEITGLGMPLFFTLSGFIIHYVYADAFARNWRGAIGEFALSRFSRLYPLYFVLLAYSLWRGPMGEALARPANFSALLAYLGAYYTWWPFTVDGHPLLDWYYHISWSVSTEIFFYFVYAVVLFRIARIANATRCLTLLVMLCVAAYTLFYVAFLTRDGWETAALRTFPGFSPHSIDFGNSFYRWLLYTSPYARIFEFIAGCLICQLYRLVRAQPMLAPRVTSDMLAAVALVVITVQFVAFRYFGEHEPWLAVGNHSFRAFFVSLHMNFLFAPACCLMIFALAKGGSSIGSALSSSVCVKLGDVSYSTYLWHPLAERVFFHAGIAVEGAPFVFAAIALIYAVSFVLYWTIELPAKRLLRVLLMPHRFVRAKHVI